MKGSSRTALLAVVAAALALGGLSLAAWARWSAHHLVEDTRADAASAAEQLAGILQTAVSTARLRASAIAGTPSVRAAVETDSATVRDMARAQAFVFQPAAGETIELFQVQRGQRPTSLLRAPEHARPIALAAADEVRLAVESGALVLTVAAPSVPLYAHGGLRGAVALSTRVDLAPLNAAVAANGLQAEVTGLALPLSLSSPPPAEGGRALTVPVPFDAAPGARLAVRATLRGGDGGGATLWTGRVLLLAALAAALLLLLEHRRGRDLPALRAEDDAPTSPIAVNAPVTTLPPEPTVKERLHPDGERHLVLAWSAAMPTPITQLKPVQESAPIVVDPRGDQLAGRYRLLQPLGRGSGADVYLAQSFVAGAPGTVALKMLQPGGGADRQQYLEAARRQMRVPHPNVVQVHDVSGEEFAYVAMEYVEGCTLEQLLREIASSREFLPLPQAVAVVSAICRALDAAQEARDDRGARRPLVHGALKPSNVLVGRHNVIKLGDFGAPPSPSDRHAPEQYAGKRPDRRSDVYAVGLILHELVTGRRWAPPPADTKQWPPLPAPTSLRPELPRELDHVIAKATRFGPRGRHATAGELEADLARATADAAHASTALLLGDWVERARRGNRG